VKAGWSETTLGEVCEVLDRLRKPITKKDRVEGPIPYYGATGIVDYVEGFIFDEPLVLVGEDGAKWDGGEATAFAVDGKTWVNNHAHVLRPDRKFLTDEWLIFWLTFSDLSEFVTGVTVPKLNQKNLRSLKHISKIVKLNMTPAKPFCRKQLTDYQPISLTKVIL